MIMQLDQEILGLEERKKVLSEVCKICNEEFVTFAKAAGEQTDMSQIELLLTKGSKGNVKVIESENVRNMNSK